MRQDTNNNAIYAKLLYLFLIAASIIIMIVAAFMTHGNNTKEVHVSLKELENTNDEVINKTDVGITDLSKIPEESVIIDILNDVIPNVCDECAAEKHMDCLEDYKINKILVGSPEHKDQLFIHLTTKEEKYIVTIDLNNDNKVLKVDGKINDDACRGPEINLMSGEDPDGNDYVNTNPRE